MENYNGENPSTKKGANLPVETVSWNDCQIFIRKLNAITKKSSAYLQKRNGNMLLVEVNIAKGIDIAEVTLFLMLDGMVEAGIRIAIGITRILLVLNNQ